MSNAEGSDCLETTLDMLCYEMIRGSLSPEMEILFAAHLDACPACRERVSNFLGLLGLGAEPGVSRMVHRRPEGGCCRAGRRLPATPYEHPVCQGPEPASQGKGRFRNPGSEATEWKEWK